MSNSGAHQLLPLRRDDLVCHDVDDEALLYDGQRNATYRLNATARFIWQRCDGRRSCDEIARAVTAIWDTGLDRATLDLGAALSQMSAQRLIRWIDSQPDDSAESNPIARAERG